MTTTKTQKKLNIATVGYGGMGTYHVHGLIPAESDYLQVVGTYDVDPDRKAIAEETGTYVYPAFEAILDDQEVDAVLIATPNDSHKDLAIQAMRAGKHVICEKPVAMNTQEFDEMLAVAAETDRVLMIHQNRRWDPDFLQVKEMFTQRQAIGDVFQIESRVHGANGIPGDWRHLKAHGGGMVLDWGIHLLDQILWLVDSPIQSVHSDLSYILADEVDDGFMAYITFENGIRAHVEVGTSNFVSLPRWYIKGNQGTAIIEDWEMNGRIVKATGNAVENKPSPITAGVGLTKTMAPPVDGVTETVALPKAKPAEVSFYRNFYDVVTAGAEPIVKNAEVREVMQLIDRILSQ
ncbi:Gfo/Idh/MocA family oxidoreductase [Aerococcaceae bacterium 50-4]